MLFTKKNKMDTVEIEIPKGYEAGTPRFSTTSFDGNKSILIPLKKKEDVRK